MLNIAEFHIFIQSKPSAVVWSLENLIAKTKEIVRHELNLIAIRQGGLLDVLYHDGYVYFSYTHDIEKKYSSTAIARGNLIDN